MSDDDKVAKIEKILKEFVVPNKANDGLSGKVLAQKILDAVKDPTPEEPKAKLGW